MKLIIQIPCFNEEATLEETVLALPKSIEGIDVIETQIIDDGSTDRTIEVARKLNINHIISFKQNKGLAAAFRAGVANALEQGADILVNTDGDNQYYGGDIEKLIAPIINAKAEVVVGARPIEDHPEFGYFKKKLQKIGSWTLRQFSQTNIPDAASGFRAYSQDALIHLNVYSDFSYCMETLIQTGLSNLKVLSVDIRVNPQTRKSRLFSSIPQYVWKSGNTMLSIFLLYRGSQVLTALSALLFLVALAIFARYFFYIGFFDAPSSAFWPSIIIGGAIFTVAFFSYIASIMCLQISANRKLLEEILYRARREDCERK